MEKVMSKHPHYELLNLIGYGLAKFDKLFIKEFQCSSKSEFYRYIVSLGFAETTGVVKNRMDLFEKKLAEDEEFLKLCEKYKLKLK